VAENGLETWTPLDAGDDEHATFQYQSGAWRAVGDGTAESRQLPSRTRKLLTATENARSTDRRRKDKLGCIQ
jgi:hypothetical protein